MKLFALLGKVFLFVAMCVFLAAVSLFGIGAYLVTWPLARLSPRGRRKTAVSNLMVSIMALAWAFAHEEEGSDECKPS